MSSRVGATSGVERALSDELVQAQAYVDLVLDQSIWNVHVDVLDAFTTTVMIDGLDEAAPTTDLEVYLELHKYGFTGPAWDEVIAEPLTIYGAGVLTSWSSTGWIFKVLRDKNVRLTPPASDTERRRLARDMEMQQELVRHAVAAALVKFQRGLQEESGWTPFEGLSMKSYFLGACVFAFGNEFRKWRRRERILFHRSDGQLGGADLADLGRSDSRSSMFADPESAVVANSMIREAFAPLTPEEQVIVLAKAWGYTAGEIVELYPELTQKAVEQRWARLKAKHEWINRLSNSVRGMS